VDAQLFREVKPDFSLKEATDYLTSFGDDGFGCLWLYHPNGTQLGIMINGQRSYPHFFPAADRPGWQIAATNDADWNTMIEFLADNREPTPMPLALVVPVERCVDIVTYYWENGGRNDKENWTSLVAGEP